MGSWTDDLSQLTLLKDTLGAYISADDVSMLNERGELLQRQWEELCHQVRGVRGSTLAPGGGIRGHGLKCQVVWPTFGRVS